MYVYTFSVSNKQSIIWIIGSNPTWNIHRCSFSLDVQVLGHVIRHSPSSASYLHLVLECIYNVRFPDTHQVTDHYKEKIRSLSFGMWRRVLWWTSTSLQKNLLPPSSPLISSKCFESVCQTIRCHIPDTTMLDKRNQFIAGCTPATAASSFASVLSECKRNILTGHFDNIQQLNQLMHFIS
jgi:hypothetical protein